MQIRGFFVLLVFVLNSIVLYAQKDTEALLKELDATIELRPEISERKDRKIKQLTDALKKGGRDDEELFDLYSHLSEEYESFVYDSAFYYTRKSQLLAYGLQDASRIALSKMKMGFILLSKGLFSQALDTLNTVRQEMLSPEKRMDYYSYLVRGYQDLSNYSRDPFYSPQYQKEAEKYCKIILKESSEGSYHHLNHQALIYLFHGEFEKARNLFEELVRNPASDQHQVAIVYSWLGFIHSVLNQSEQAKQYLIKAAIADIRSSVKETVALRELAKLLFQEGKIELAHKYILIAKEDADFYGTEQRKLEISYILPIIGGERLRLVEHQKETVFKFSLIVSILTLLLILLALIVYQQLRKLRKARQSILDSNEELVRLNDHLQEANKIKEEYVGYYFNFSSQLIDKMDQMNKSVSRQIMTKQYDAIATLLKGYNAKTDRKQLFENFDRIFLNLFPDFVERFNALFKKEDQIQLKKEHVLNTDLRIFALIRLGITDNEKIAKILNFSVNTIYTYKTRIRNRSTVSNEEFEAKIMEIRSV
ncbi:MAG: DUF6377 domain-containing protein [Marinifilaceae bacterium]